MEVRFLGVTKGNFKDLVYILCVFEPISLVFKKLAILKFPERAVGIFISVSPSISFLFLKEKLLI